MSYRADSSELEINHMRITKSLQVTGALVGLSILAAAWSQTPQTPATKPLPADQSPQVKAPPVVWLASDLIGMKVVTQKGESLGKIEDVVVHPGGEPSYAVLSFGGWLGMGDKLFAMPWSVLRTVEPNSAKKDSALSLVLPVDKERIKNAPGFDKKNWPSMANPDWSKDIDTFYAGDLNPNTAPNAKRPIDAAVRGTPTTWRATELKGTDVKTPSGEKLGDLKEVAIDSNGRVSFVAVSVGGFLGVGDRLVAVPWDALNFSAGGDKGDKQLITLASTKKQLEGAPQFKEGKDNSVEMCDPKWIGRLYEYYGSPVYWNTTATSVSGGGPGSKN